MVKKNQGKQKTKETVKSKEENIEQQINEMIADDDNLNENEEEITVEIQEDKKVSADKEENIDVKLAEWQDKYLRLSAEFDNYRKRTLKEKVDLIKTASADIMLKILPVIDDFERAIGYFDNNNPDAANNGIILIYDKLRDILAQQGLKEIEALNKEFDTDIHEAVTKVPAPEENLKGKVVDVIQKGYFLYDKVIRYAKVVVGE